MSTLTVKAAADIMNIPPNGVFRLIDERVLAAAKLGRTYVLLERDVMDYIEQPITTQTSTRMGGQSVRGGVTASRVPQGSSMDHR